MFVNDSPAQTDM